MYLPPVSAAPSAPLCAECSPSGSKKNGCLPQTLTSALGAERLVELGDLGGRGDRIADHAAAHVAHHWATAPLPWMTVGMPGNRALM